MSPPPPVLASIASVSVFIFLLLASASDALFLTNFEIEDSFFVPEFTPNPSYRLPESSNSAFTGQTLADFEERSNVIISGKSTILSENRTFQLGFFSPNGGSKWYLGIWYASTPTPTYVWVANRETPISNQASSTLRISEENGKLVIMESPNSVIWQSTNVEKANGFRFLDNGNLILLSATESLVWQSFDFPTDTWLPGMNITRDQSLISWRSLADPSPGLYSLRLNPREYNEFELVYNRTEKYWNTGNWTGTQFACVPQMTIQYIYRFHFADPFSPAAAFWYTEIALDNVSRPPLTRFQMYVDGQLKQFTWSSQVENWNMFWSQPENVCRVHKLCGEFGFCESTSSYSTPKPCLCLSGFKAASGSDWESGDYSSGCVRDSSDLCDKTDEFMEVGVVNYEGAKAVSFQGSRSSCERSCLDNCSCVGLIHDQRNNLCKNLYGSLLNLRNLSFQGISDPTLFLRVPKEGNLENDESNSVVLIGSILGSIAFFGLAIAVVVILQMRRRRRKTKGKGGGEDGGGDGFPLLNLKVFSYKELYTATRGFSDKLGHGGFGAVFKGDLPDSTTVAVKRLERPGSGEKEFRAEVCTIGSIQHVNLVRLRGFCSENSHRLLVYDYMPNGSLSVYLGPNSTNMSWDVRFRIAVGTARGIAYLHEECRDCIIHCDIKPDNILLDSDYTAKVSDFGLAKLVGRDFSRVLATMRGTWGYVAPEWISGVAITTKADVYSYGMTLLELLGGRRNVEARPSGKKGEKWFLPPYTAQQISEGDIAAVIDHRLGNAYKWEEAKRVALVAIWCIQDNEDARPTMGNVVKMLEGVVEVASPPAPKLLQALISGESYHGIDIDSGTGVPISGDCSSDYMGVSSYGSQSSPANPSFCTKENVNV